MAIVKDSVLPQGSLVLVTGVNGLLGANTADQFLEHGFRVRGTARSAAKGEVVTKIFQDKYGKDKFELAEVADLAAEGALTEALKGVDAVAHVASDVSFGYDPNVVVTTAVNTATAVLKAAFATPSVKRFIQCSSSSAVVGDIPDGKEPITTTYETWNEDAVKEAWAEPYEPTKAGAVYGASKTQQEQAIWKYTKEHQSERPDLVVNSVNPNLNFGKSLDQATFGYPSSSGMVAALYNNVVPQFLNWLRNQYWIDVADTGRLFVAAATFPDVKNERIFGFAGPLNFNEVLDILRKEYPDRKFPENFDTTTKWHTIPQRERAEELLKRLGRPGWVTLEEAVKRNVPGEGPVAGFGNL